MHLPDVTGTGQLGDYYLNRSGMVDMPEEWKAGIFLPRFGLHIEMCIRDRAAGTKIPGHYHSDKGGIF